MEYIALNHTNKHLAQQFSNVRDLSTQFDKVDAFIDDEHTLTYMALDGEKVVGLVWGYTLQRMDDNPMMFIYSVDVIESYRKQGIATTLVEKFIDFANEKGYRNTFLITDKDNIAANNLYKKTGGERHDDKVLYIYKR